MVSRQRHKKENATAYSAMCATDSPSAIRRFFAGLTEYTFTTRLGVADPPVIDYLSDLLSRFFRCDAMRRPRNLPARPSVQVADLLSQAQPR